MRGLSRAAILAFVFLAAGCGSKTSGAPVGVSTKEGASAPPSDKAIDYAFDALDDARPVASPGHRGKPTVLAFVSTGDLTSQAQVDYLVAMEKNDGKVVNYAIVALHPRKEIVLVESYTSTLGVTFPVALADPSQTGPRGPFGDIPAVPTVVILDRQSRLVWKHTGLAKAEELRSKMKGL